MAKDPARELARQKTVIWIVIGALVFMAAIALTAATRLALPLRIFIASTDLIAAAVLWLLLRQKFNGR